MRSPGSGKSAAVTTASTPGRAQGLAGVDLQDAGVRDGAAQDAAVQQAGHLHVGAVDGPAGHLVHAVVANGPGADDLEARDDSQLMDHAARKTKTRTGRIAVISSSFPCSRRSCFRAYVLRGGIEHRPDDLVVAGAAAQVAGQPVADLGLGRRAGSAPAAPWPPR